MPEASLVTDDAPGKTGAVFCFRRLATPDSRRRRIPAYRPASAGAGSDAREGAAIGAAESE